MVAIAALAARSADAGNVYAYADLICDSARNIALALFAISYRGPPAYDKLPLALDHGLSSRPGTGRRRCRLANGWRVKLRNGSAVQVNNKVQPLLDKQLKKGARIVAKDFDFRNWTPEKVENIADDGEGRSHTLYLYRK